MSDNFWWDKAIRDHEKEHGPSGGAWNISMVLQRLHAARPHKHDYWGAGEADCPKELKAGNGELHTLRCKKCGKDYDGREDNCFG